MTLSQNLQYFIPSVVNQLAVDLKRLHGMGLKKVAVTALEPLGCLPQATAASSFQGCNGTQNAAVAYHNLLLSQAVAKLNNETTESPFVVLDLYGSFMSVIQHKADRLGIIILLTFRFILPKSSAPLGVRLALMFLLREFQVREPIEAMLHGDKQSVLVRECGREWGEEVHNLRRPGVCILLGHRSPYAAGMECCLLSFAGHPSRAILDYEPRTCLIRFV